MELERLAKIGESLGFKGDELQDFITRERENAKEERAREREARAEERELIKLRLELEKAKGNSNNGNNSCNGSVVQAPKLPTFNDSKDQMDAYLNRFERYATTQRWPEEAWATNLSALLTGKALETYARLSDVEAQDYGVVKKALLNRYSLTSEGFRKKLRAAKPDNGETASQFVVRMRSYLDKWVELAGAKPQYEALVELMLMEQFLTSCSQPMVLFIRERRPTALSEMVEIADRFVESRSGWYSPAGHKGQQTRPAPNQSSRPNTGTARPKPDAKPREETPRDKPGCFLCGSTRHFARNCQKRHKPEKLAAGVDKSSYPQARDGKSSGATAATDEKEERDVVADNRREGDKNRRGTGEKGCLLIDSCFSCSPTTQVHEKEQRKDTMLPSVSAACGAKPVRAMPVVSGLLNGKKVTVLRDSGCSTAVAKAELIEHQQLTEEVRTCVLIDGTVREFQVAKVHVDTPYYEGKLEVLCVTNPIYDLILGNVPGVREPSQPDREWTPTEPDEDTALAVETRSKRRDVTKPLRELRVPGQKEAITAEQFRQEQEKDASLGNIRRQIESGEEKVSRKGNKTKFVMKGKLMYRKFSSSYADSKDATWQLIVPEKLRRHVLSLAHESLLGGHLATKKTSEKISANFYWPGMYADTRRFCRSCDGCQRSLPKGKVSKVPLGTTPLIDEPFRRVAVDIVGPITPVTGRGNRYILTLVDYATRYPEAMALRNIDTQTVAEALLSMFSRVGFPREMLTDRGTQFTSGVMKEVSRLLSITHLTTTPYHPACNGLVERFNGTLKLMLKKMCEEQPREWDRYLDSLLFAYRETPHDSTGFAPFELLYGRDVRGPLMILKELWTDEDTVPETKTAYQYVMDLREKLEKTCEIASQELMKAHEGYRKNYNRRAKARSFKVGDEVLLLLPTDKNKLLMHWKGPFRVVGVVGKMDYRIDTGQRVTTFHANLLKRYLRKEDDQQGNANTGTPFDVAAASVVEEDDDEPHTDDAETHTDPPKPKLLEVPTLQQTQTSEDVKVSPDLTSKQKSEAKQLLNKYSDSLTDVPGVTNAGYHDIELTDPRPIQSRPYPLPHALREVVKREVKEMLDYGVIEPSTSPYASPIVLVSKKDGTNRFCCDFRKLNVVTVKDAEPIPDQDEIFAKLANDQYFSKIDLTKGYWQMPLTDRAKPLTAFVTPDGLYQFRTMPFGLVNAPASFSRLMRSILRGVPCVDNFIDDILIHTVTWEQHLDVLEEVLHRLRHANLTAKPNKCFVGFNTIEFLGHQVSRGCVRPTLDKVESIVSAPRPETKKQLRSFIGLAGYYRKFVPNFSATAVPLTDRTKKGEPNKVKWEKEQEQAFRSLKAALANAPILQLPDVTKPFILRTDASDNGVGAVLLQETEGEKFPVAYASKKLLPRERVYSTIEKECLAVVWAVQKFEPYLYGREFVLEVDHEPLRAMRKGKVANARVLRWSLALQPYQYRVEAIKGKENCYELRQPHHYELRQPLCYELRQPHHHELSPGDQPLLGDTVTVVSRDAVITGRARLVDVGTDAAP
ncbi:uncharacterized protein [Diadema setosum]|uniref:uncharacterized protein n=1 Tax=Diadema setosum TaxID=31175 RepID=UPI003B3A59E4